MAPRAVNENDNEDNNDESGAGTNFLDFHNDLSVLAPSIFASRSSSPLSSQLTGMTLDHLSMTNHPSSTNQTQSVDENASTVNEDGAIQGLLKLKNSKSKEDGDNNDSQKEEDNNNDRNKNGKNDQDMDDDSKMDDRSKSNSNSNSKMEMDNNDNNNNNNSSLKSVEITATTTRQETQRRHNMAAIDWENESDDSEDEERYLSKKDRDIIKKEERRLKISTKMGDDFKIPEGYLAHSIFVCPLGSDYVPDPQARLSCGHIISYGAFLKLQTIKRSRQHEANRNRSGVPIPCPICDTPSDSDKDVRFVYLGRFPNLRVDPRFSDILDKKDLDQSAQKWVPGFNHGAQE